MIDEKVLTNARTGVNYTEWKWEVWFITPLGLTEDYSLALDICKENDWDQFVIVPVCVAVTNDGSYYEVVNR